MPRLRTGVTALIALMMFVATGCTSTNRDDTPSQLQAPRVPKACYLEAPIQLEKIQEVMGPITAVAHGTGDVYDVCMFATEQGDTVAVWWTNNPPADEDFVLPEGYVSFATAPPGEEGTLVIVGSSNIKHKNNVHKLAQDLSADN